MVLQSAAIVANKLLVDGKITACVNLLGVICNV